MISAISPRQKWQKLWQKYFLPCFSPLCGRNTFLPGRKPTLTLIDNVFTNVTNHKVTSGILVSDITDHLPIFVFCTYPNPNRADQKCNVKKRIINEKTLLSLSNNLAEECWDNVFRSADVDTALWQIYDNLF